MAASSNGQRTGVADDVGFERSRIDVLKEERQYIQKKTFTKWINSFLNKVDMHCNDLFTDLADGKLLLKLLEIISGEKIGRPSIGKMRVHKVENLNKSLSFLHTKVHLESIGAEDIVDGNPKLILGLIWTIILRFQIQDIREDPDSSQSGQKASAKEALLLWAQRKTKDYAGVKVVNFTSSWRNGLGFSALIHSHRPDLIDYDRLHPDQPIENLNYAFEVAEKHLGVARLLDAEDMVDSPDEKSVMTYVSSYYHTFAKKNKEEIGGKRIAKIIASQSEIDRLKQTFEGLCSDLIAWLIRKTGDLGGRSFPNNIAGLQQEFIKFKEYRVKEKPPRMMERGNIEVAFFDIQTKLKSLGQKPYQPLQGFSIRMVDNHWKELEIAEHQREKALREAMTRLERLERLAERFDKKAQLREVWLKEMTTLLSEQKVGKTMAQIDAALKKFEAIKADIQPREDRFGDLVALANELVREDFHGKDQTKRRCDDVVRKWRALLDLLEKRRRVLDLLGDLIQMVRDADSIYADLKNLETPLKSTDTGQHLASVQALVQKHFLTEAELAKMGKRIGDLDSQAPRHIAVGNEEATLLQNSLSRLNDQYKLIQKLAEARKLKLDEALKYHQFEDDAEEEDSWAMEKLRILESMPIPRDARQAQGSLHKAKALSSELNGRFTKVQMLQASGEGLISRNHFFRAKIQTRMASLTEHWNNLRSLLRDFIQSMEAAVDYFQYHTEADEIESWLKESSTILNGMDPTGEIADVESLMRRHARLEEEIGSYEPDVKRLSDQVIRLQKLGVVFTKLSETPRTIASPEKETAPFEMLEEDQIVQQVAAMFPFKVAELIVKKGEVMTLIDKPNADWWHVRKSDGSVGAAPANHLMDVEPRIIKKRVEKQTTVARQTSRVGQNKEIPSMLDPKQLAERQSFISNAYIQLKNDAAEKRKLFGEAVGAQDFLRECNELKNWIAEQNHSVLVENSDEPLHHQQKRFSTFIPEFNGRKKQLAQLQKTGTEFITRNHRSSRDVKNTLDELLGLWRHLEEAKLAKERELEYRNGMEAFNDACKNASDYISEKSVALRIEPPVSRDISAMKNLHKKIANSERELIPIQQMIESVRQRGEPMKKQYVKEEPFITAKEKDLQAQARHLQDYLSNKQNELEGDVSQSMFESSLGELAEWQDRTVTALQESPDLADQQAAAELRQQHGAVCDDIRAHDPEYDYVVELAKKSLKANPSFEKEARQLLGDLEEKRKHLSENAIEKGAALEYVESLLDLSRKINRALDDVARLNSVLADTPEVGTTHAEVETLLRRHEDLDRDLDGTETRNQALLKAGSALVNKPPNNRALIRKPHEKVSSMLFKLQEALKRFPGLRDQSQQKKVLLLDSLSYQTWKGDVEDLNQWMDLLLPVMDAEPSEDDISSEKAYRRHAKQVAEINANTERIQQFSKDGREMIVRKHFASPRVAVLLEEMLTKWEDLAGKAEARNNKFEQAAKARGFYDLVDTAKSRLTQIQLMLEEPNSDENSDPRKLRSELKNAESNIKHAETMVERVRNDAEFLAANNHFNGPKLLKTAGELDGQLRKLHEPAKRRWLQLDEIVQQNQTAGDLEKEIAWIEERLKLLKTTHDGKTLDETASLLAKLDGIEAEMQTHEPVYKRALADGVELAKNYPDNERYSRLCETVREKWAKLLELLPLRRQNLRLAEQGHQYWLDFADLNEWVEHNLHQMRGSPSAKDADATERLIAQNNQMGRDLGTEKELVEDLDKQAKALIQHGHPDAKNISSSQKALKQKMEELEELVKDRSKQLSNAQTLFGFQEDCSQMENWLQDQIRVAENTDCGIDSATLGVATADFSNFDKKVSEKGPRQMKMIEEEAEILKKQSPTTAAVVNKRLADLRSLWAELNDAIQRRDQLLDKMGDIFSFDDKVAEVTGTIQDTLAMCFGEEDGELKDIMIKLKRHDVAENEVRKIADEMDKLKDCSDELLDRYPGPDGDNVEKKMENVLKSWDALKRTVLKRRTDLEGLAAGHVWLSSARALQKWGEDTLAGMSASQQKDKISVDVLIQDHNDVKADISAHKADFERLLADSGAVGGAANPLSGQVKERKKDLKVLQDKLQQLWEGRRASLEEESHVRKFLRDLDQLDVSSNAQETYLNTKEPSDLTVEQIMKLQTRHAAFEKVVAQQAEKLRGLTSHADVLISDHKIDPKFIFPRLKEVTERRKKVGSLTTERAAHLNNALVYAEFVDVASDMDAWIDDKITHMRSNPIDELSFEEKIRKLIKHQTFEAELHANSAAIEYVKKSAGELLKNRHEKSAEVDATMQALLKKWSNLLRMADQRSKALDDAKDMVEFENVCDRTEKWMRDKEQMLSAEDLGTDLEHCLFLQRKLNDVGSDMKFDETQIQAINALADKLSRSGVGNMEVVHERRRNLNTNWADLQAHLDQYRVKLKLAKDLHALGNSIDDTTDLLVEKAKGLALEEATDVDSATAMIRVHESLLWDFDACLRKIDTLDRELLDAHKLHPSIVQQFKLDEKMGHLRETWQIVNTKIDAKKAHLDRIHALLRFLKDVQEFCQWSENLQAHISNGGLAQDAIEAERLTEHHNDLKAQIQGREQLLGHLVQKSRGLSLDVIDAKDPANEAETRLKDTWNQLNAAWDQRNVMLRQCNDQQVFNELVDQVDSWLSAKEAFLSNDELGSSMSEVESILRKHNAFENTIQRQSDKVTDLDKFAQRLIADQHYAGNDIMARYDTVQSRLEHIQSRSSARKAQLEESERYQQFFKSLAEFNAWMEEKYQLAHDANWKDPVHLEHKLQKQTSFETELNANLGRMELLLKEGEAMIADDHFATEDIRQRVSDLTADWSDLLEASAEKRRRLLEVQTALRLNRRIDDFEGWLDSVETILKSEDVGGNLSTCLKLVEKTEATKLQVLGELATLTEINQQAEALADDEHFLSGEIRDRLLVVNKRYNKLSDVIKLRFAELDDAQNLHHFNLEHHEIVLWYKEKQTQLTVKEVATNLSEAQNLLRKVLQLEDEIVEYSANVQRTLETGCQLVAASDDSLATEQITPKLDELRDTYQVIKKLCADRRLVLEDSVEAQKFYAEIYELESAFAQKKILLDSNDTGDDEDSTKLLMKKLDAVERDVHSFGKNVERLADLADSMQSKKNLDSVNVQRRFETLKERHRDLNNLVKLRRQQLLDGQKLFGFFEDCLSLLTALREKMLTADSEDYGTDVEHVDILILNFGNFQRGLSILQIRVKNLNEKALLLCGEGHPQVQAIKEKTDDVNEAWTRLQESAHSRHEALLGAREVHIFVRDCDETIGWIQERDTIVSSEDFGQDLESVQSLIRRHDGFQRDLAPFGQRVEQLGQESSHLVTAFPDARTHVERKHNEMLLAWRQLIDKSTQRRERLNLAESLQSYLNKYREFSLWISEMLAIITSYDLPQDVRRAESLLVRHKEHRAEIESRFDQFSQIRKEGLQVIQRGHFMADEIKDKVERLEKGYDSLMDVWKRRNELYALNLDVQIFMRDCSMLQSWMRGQEPTLRDENLGESIQNVEELIRKHEDFQKTVENQEERFNLVRRLTELEKAYAIQVSREADARANDRLRHEMEKLNQLKAQDARMRRLDGNKTPEAEAGELGRKISLTRAVTSVTPSHSRRLLQGGIQKSDSFNVSKEDKAKMLLKPSFSIKRPDRPDRPDSSSRMGISADKLPPVDMEGLLDRKQELDPGRHKSASRSWKSFHTVLCGQLLCFFKRRQSSYEKNSAAPPLNLYECIISPAFHHKRKDHFFRIHLRDGSEYLFGADSQAEMQEWIEKIQFHAALPPNMQLLSYREGQVQASMQEQDGESSSDRTLNYARTLPRTSPSPSYSNGSAAEQTVAPPVAKPRSRVNFNEQEKAYTNGSNGHSSAEVVAEVPSEESLVNQKRSSGLFGRDRVGRSESVSENVENVFSERGVDIDLNSVDRARTSSSSLALEEGRASVKAVRGATLPAGSSHGADSLQLSPESKKDKKDRSGSRTSLIGKIFSKGRHDNAKEKA